MSLLNSLESDPNKRMFTKEQILKTYYGYDKDLYPNVDWIERHYQRLCNFHSC